MHSLEDMNFHEASSMNSNSKALIRVKRMTCEFVLNPCPGVSQISLPTSDKTIAVELLIVEPQQKSGQ